MVLEDRSVPKGSNVTKDQLICLNPFTLGAPCREDLRLVTVWDQDNQRKIQLLTNVVRLSAATISAIYLCPVLTDYRRREIHAKLQVVE
jgi:hypothetical protein